MHINTNRQYRRPLFTRDTTRHILYESELLETAKYLPALTPHSTLRGKNTVSMHTFDSPTCGAAVAAVNLS
jgi:hypothetical protein